MRAGAVTKTIRRGLYRGCLLLAALPLALGCPRGTTGAPQQGPSSDAGLGSPEVDGGASWDAGGVVDLVGVPCDQDAQCPGGLSCDIAQYTCQVPAALPPVDAGQPDSGSSVGFCPPPLDSCPSRCTLLSADPFNCGACGNVCPTGIRCVDGGCEGGCPDQRVLCGSACTDLSADPGNCGRCGNICLFGQSCQQGSCTGCGPDELLDAGANCGTSGTGTSGSTGGTSGATSGSTGGTGSTGSSGSTGAAPIDGTFNGTYIAFDDPNNDLAASLGDGGFEVLGQTLATPTSSIVIAVGDATGAGAWDCTTPNNTIYYDGQWAAGAGYAGSACSIQVNTDAPNPGDFYDGTFTATLVSPGTDAGPVTVVGGAFHIARSF